MLHILKTIDLSKNTSSEQIYTFFKTSCRNINKKIRSKIQNFNTPFELVEYYSKVNIKKIMNLLDSLDKSLNIIGDFENTAKFFSSNLDQYMSYLSKIFLVTFLISKLQTKINDVLISTKNNLLKMNLENKTEINPNELILTLINTLIKDNKKQHHSRRSTRDDTNYQTPKNFTSKNNDIIKKTKIIVDSFKTAKFSELENNNETQKSLKNDSNNIIEDYYKPKGSQFSFSRLVDFPLEKSSKLFKNILLNENEECIKRTKTPQKIENRFRIKKKKTLKKNFSNKIQTTNMVINLLETINSMYKTCLISADEKVKLKTMIISKSVEIEKLYIKYHDDKNLFKNKLKNLLD